MSALDLEDPALIEKRIAYVDAVRAHRRHLHTAGFAICLAGVLLLAWAAMQGPGATSPVGYAAVTIIASGWATLIYVIVARQAYVRAHPFDPNA
jgi:quinol-cytochrome oxidoreductase complex cytochrome b subunit